MLGLSRPSSVNGLRYRDGKLAYKSFAALDGMILLTATYQTRRRSLEAWRYSHRSDGDDAAIGATESHLWKTPSHEILRISSSTVVWQLVSPKRNSLTELISVVMRSARWNVAHGITSCITLPHAMRFMAGIAPERFGPIGEGLGIPFDRANPRASALACAGRTAEFIASFDVPRSLKDAGVSRDEILQIVPAVLHEIKERAVVDKPITEAEVIALLEAAY